MKLKKNSTMQKGFTLVELMIVVAIIGIMAAFAYNSYQKYVLRSHRVDARNMLQEIQQKLEANYTLTHTYNKMPDSTVINTSTLQAWGLNQSPINGTTAYEISFSEGPTDSSYTLKAAAVNKQVNDTCKTFNLNNYNVKTANDLTSRDDTSRECWSK